MLNETLGIYMPNAVLDFTEGKKALICGGQGARPESQAKLRKAFEFEELEWVMGETGKERTTELYRRAISMRKYSIVFFLTSFISHHGMEAVKLAKEIGLTVIMIPSGYSINSFSKAIEEQVCRNIERQESARSSGQMVASGGRQVY